DGHTSLMHASQKGRDEIVSLLILYGANIEAVTINGISPLLMACNMGHVSTAKILLDGGANPHTCDNAGNTPIQVAIDKGYHELISIMNITPTGRLQSLSLDQEASGTSNKKNLTPSGDSSTSSSAATSNLECVVCMDPRTSTVMTLPCRHAVTCQKCMNDMEARGDNRCPLCRTEIQQRIPIFIN
ncbi:unnamed protein product, partial [Meganyctiphanes norvegica]